MSICKTKYGKVLDMYEVSNLLDTSVNRLKQWALNGKLSPIEKKNEVFYYDKNSLIFFDEAQKVFNSKWNEEEKIKAKKKYTSIELFAGAGGMAIGMEQAGFKHIALNEIDKWACETLRINRPNWNILEGDISKFDFSNYKGKVDLVTGGFPCQAFSYAGKKLGFDDTRGTLFFEFARTVVETKPKVLIGENVKGLYNHDKGKTLKIIKNTIKEIGYTLIEPRVLKAMYYKVPQKRERLFLVGIRNDLIDKIDDFNFPSPFSKVLTLQDAFKKGILFNCNVPESIGDKYLEKKFAIMEKVPEGGNWKDLPDNLQREYMGGSYYLGGGKTGLARRLSMKSPSLTLVCSPAMKQTERCHPTETRPLTVRESARIQTFPDNWQFYGSKTQAYKQIGNAVPVNLALAIGRSVIRFLNSVEAG